MHIGDPRVPPVLVALMRQEAISQEWLLQATKVLMKGENKR